MKDLKKYIPPIGFWTFASLIVIWQGAGWLHLLPKFILPTPLEILRAFVDNGDLLASNALATVQAAFIGLLCGALLALVLAIVMDRFNWVYQALYPMLVVTQTIPTIALAPILVLWLGYGLLPKVVLIMITTTFPIVIGLLDGFKSVDRDVLTLFSLMHAKYYQLLWHLKLPMALPQFFSGLKISASYAFIAALISEWLGGLTGLGVYMMQSKKLFAYATMFAIIILISLLSILSVKLLSFIEKKLIKWR